MYVIREIGSVVLFVPFFYFRKKKREWSFYQTIAYVRLWTISEAAPDRALEEIQKLKYDATQRTRISFP